MALIDETIPTSTSLTVLTTAIQDLEPDSAATLRACFEEMFSQVEDWTARAKLIKVTDESQKREMKLARESRLALREIRVKAEHARKRLKEDSTRRGKAIDGIANVLKALVEPIEAHLLEQETFAERAEATRRDALKSARESALRALGADPSVYANLGETSEETWELTLDAARAAREAKLEEAKQAELVRVEAERIAAEKREAARVAAAHAEAQRVEREKSQLEENARLKEERAKLEREATELKLDKDKAERERLEVLERERVSQIQAQREREDAESRARLEREEAARAQQAAALAPDRDKLAAFADAIRALDVPILTTPAGKAAAIKVREQIEKMAAWVAKTGAAL